MSDYSEFHQRIYAMLIGIYQNLATEPGNAAWGILHQFILDETLPVSGRNNAVWIVLGITGQLFDDPAYHELVNDWIYMVS